ncbi:MAG: DUF6265 family protein [Candidatus Thorarchaeota archaeon]|jgi:hypothetical protein
MTFSKIPLKGKSVEDLNFLTGHWEGTSEKDTIEEFWLPVLEGKMAGIFRWMKEGEIFVYEIIALSMIDDEVHMYLRHFDKEFVAWEEKDKPRCFVATEITDTDVVFVDTENPEKGFLRYSTSKDNTLEFFDYEADGKINFQLEFKKAGIGSQPLSLS